MATDDFSGVTVAFAAASYPKGATMTLAVNGQNRHTGDPTITHQAGTAHISLQATGGATTTIDAQIADIVTTTPGTVTFEDVVIVSVTDSAGRTYTVSPGGHSATAIA